MNSLEGIADSGEMHSEMLIWHVGAARHRAAAEVYERARRAGREYEHIKIVEAEAAFHLFSRWSSSLEFQWFSGGMVAVVPSRHQALRALQLAQPACCTPRRWRHK